jgi:hypothetical protein
MQTPAHKLDRRQMLKTFAGAPAALGACAMAQGMSAIGLATGEGWRAEVGEHEAGVRVDPLDGGLLPTPACPHPARPPAPLARAGAAPDAARAAARPLALEGFVLSRSCRVVEGALIALRPCHAGEGCEPALPAWSHQRTDASGRYGFETVVPAARADRARHLHVRVEAPGRSALETRLFLPGQHGGAHDPLFRPELLVRTEDGHQRRASFTFVLEG